MIRFLISLFLVFSLQLSVHGVEVSDQWITEDDSYNVDSLNSLNDFEVEDSSVADENLIYALDPDEVECVVDLVLQTDCGPFAIESYEQDLDFNNPRDYGYWERYLDF